MILDAYLANKKTQTIVEHTNMKQNWYQVSSSKISVKAARKIINNLVLIYPSFPNQEFLCKSCQWISQPCGSLSLQVSLPSSQVCPTQCHLFPLCPIQYQLSSQVCPALCQLSPQVCSMFVAILTLAQHALSWPQLQHTSSTTAQL